jgi:hypothetical protein
MTHHPIVTGSSSCQPMGVPYTQTSGATPRKNFRILEIRGRVNGKTGLQKPGKKGKMARPNLASLNSLRQESGFTPVWYVPNAVRFSITY